MSMHTIIHDWIGAVHTIASVISLITGTQVLLMKKGSKLHKEIGYVYCLGMLLVMLTAFGIYRLFGGFGIFHLAAIVGTLTLLGGMIPVLIQRPRGRWIGLHYSFMYWSVVGLYAAFVSEVITRVPKTPFYSMLGIATFTVMIVASLLFRKYKKIWKKRYFEPMMKKEKMLAKQ